MVPRPILIASGNQHKHTEIQRALPIGASGLLRPDQLIIDTSPPDPVEDGSTYLDNAIIKARAFSDWSGLPAIADDTGLEVSALGGAPGLFAARYAGEKATFQDNVEKLLRELQVAGSADRSACFICVLVICDGDRVVHTVEGRCPGKITEEPRGSEGFGYDPVFQPENSELTFAQMSPGDKDAISHRGIALATLEDDFTRGRIDLEILEDQR